MKGWLTVGSRDQEEIPIWVAYTDVAFCVLLAMLLYVLAQVTFGFATIGVAQEIDLRQQRVWESIERAVPAAFREGLTSSRDGSLQRIRFADWILFESARAELSPDGREVLRVVGRAVAEQAHLFERIQIEGHSDVLPMRSLFPSNWELSAARAISVVRLLQDECGISPAQLSATGYASYQPVEPATDEAARRRNRRIELVFVYSTATVLHPSGRNQR